MNLKFWNSAPAAPPPATAPRHSEIGGMNRRTREAVEAHELHEAQLREAKAKPAQPAKGNPWDTLKDWPAGGLEALVIEIKNRLGLETEYTGFERSTIAGTLNSGVKGTPTARPAAITADFIEKICKQYGPAAHAGVDLKAIARNIENEKALYEKVTAEAVTTENVKKLVADGVCADLELARRHQSNRLTQAKLAWRASHGANAEQLLKLCSNVQQALHNAIQSRIEVEIKDAMNHGLYFTPSVLLTTADSALAILNSQIDMLRRDPRSMQASEACWGIALKLIK